MDAPLCSAVVLTVSLACPAFAQDAGGAAPAAEWWRGAVFYEVFVRSFADSTAGPLAGDGVGDLRGLIERLDTLNDGNPSTDTDLGVTALWLMPVFESLSYHGYDIVDYRAIDAEYGTNEDFTALVAACEARGVRVIVDLVLNHCSWAHPWFIESIDPASPRRGWFIWEPTDPGWRGAWGQDAWHPAPRLADGRPTLEGADESGPQYFGLFYHGMPDLNFRTEDVSREARDISRFWLADMGAHGFRLDAVRHLIERGQEQESTPETIAWLEGYKRFLAGVDAEAFTVGEVWADTEDVRRYIPNALDSAFEFRLAEAIVDALARGGGSRALAAQIERVRDSYPANTISTFLTNHDQDRAMSRFGGATREGFARAKAAATLLLTLPGVPFIYYGEEIGMTGSKPDPDIRTPMQWTPHPRHAGFTTGEPWRAVHADVREVNLRDQRRVPGSLWTTYRDLIALRRGTPALSLGGVRVFDTGSDAVLAFERAHDGDALMVVVNLGGAREAGCAFDVTGFAPGDRVAPIPLLGSKRPRGGRADDAGVLRWDGPVLDPWETQVLRLSRTPASRREPRPHQPPQPEAPSDP